MLFQHILLCTDGSEHALRAARVASELALRLGARLTALCVYNPSRLLAIGAFTSGAVVSETTVAGHASSFHQDVEQRTGDMIEGAGAHCQFIRAIGDPVEVIVETVQSRSADLVVIGTRGMNALKSQLLGSVSEGVVHRVHCPVLLVR